MTKANKLDKFYTKPEVAKQCLIYLREHVELPHTPWWLEPSAGNGSFSDLLHCEAYDIKPEKEGIVEADFLTLELPHTNYFTIGNPPFGKRSSLAIEFFNKCATCSQLIAFIVPVSFMKWSVQKQLDISFKLVDYIYLEPASFTENGEEYSVRTVFQIWVKNDYNDMQDLRLKKQPPIKHEDFNIWQYNATPQALKEVDNPWTIATYRQGYHDYNKLFFQEDKEYIVRCMKGEEPDKNGKLGRKQQFFFIEPLTKEAEQIILNMDFNALAERNTSTPGFGKGDFVSYYTELKNN